MAEPLSCKVSGTESDLDVGASGQLSAGAWAETAYGKVLLGVAIAGVCGRRQPCRHILEQGV